MTKLVSDELSEAQLIVMKAVWDHVTDNGITENRVEEVLRDMYGIEYAPTTVYTFLKQLREKKFIDQYKDGVIRYVPLVKEEDYRNIILNKALGFWFGGDKGKFIDVVYNLQG